jgi:hypothetical protein
MPRESSSSVDGSPYDREDARTATVAGLATRLDARAA